MTVAAARVKSIPVSACAGCIGDAAADTIPGLRAHPVADRADDPIAGYGRSNAGFRERHERCRHRPPRDLRSSPCLPIVCASRDADRSNLWGARTTGTPAASTGAVQAFDLFTDTRPNERKLFGGKA